MLCSGIIGFSNYRLRKNIFPNAQEERDYGDVEFSVNVYHQYGVYACEKGDLKEQVVKTLSGHGGILENKIRFNHWRYGNLKDVSFIYMPGPEWFPAGLKIKDLIAFLTRALEITGDQLPELDQELREYLVKAEAEKIQAFVKKQEKLKEQKKKKRMKKPPKPVKDVFDLPLKSFPLPEQVVIVLKIFSKSLASLYCFDEFLKTVGGDYDTEVIHIIVEEFKKKSSTIFELNSMIFPTPLLGNAKAFRYTLNKDNKYILRSSFKQ